MTKKKRYTPRYILGLCILPFLIIGYFFNRIIWSYITKRKPLIEWVVLTLGITILVLIVTGIVRGDFKSTKEPVDLQPSKRKHR